VSQERNAPGIFDLVDDPVVVADGFRSDRGSFGIVRKERFDGAGLVIAPGLING